MATSDKKVKILFNIPNWKKPYLGGVANHYFGLKEYWSYPFNYNIVGARGEQQGTGKYLILYDVIKFIYKLIIFNPNIVVINPSLAPNALKRDAIFLKLAKLFRKKVIMCFHGFNPNYSIKIDSNSFVRQYNCADAFLVLSSNIKSTLISWGICKPILLYSTKVENSLIDNYDIGERYRRTIKTITYLARVTKEKGIYIALDTFKLLLDKYPRLKFRIVGNGDDFNQAKQYAKDINIYNIVFTGALSGENLINEFKNADLYLFTSYHEGMPTSVLEAMAFGLPIVTRPVGGLVDFFTSDMGRMIDSFKAQDFVVAIEEYINNIDLYNATSIYNHVYAKNNFLASSVAEKIENSIINV